jgi:cytochrome c1
MKGVGVVNWQRILCAALAGLALAGAPDAAQAASKGKPPMHIHWHHDGPFGMVDRAAVQRGFLVYKQVCASCHGLKMLAYRNLGEDGGPFQAVAGKKWQERGEQPHLGVPGHGKYTVNAVDNPYIRAIAAEYTITEIDGNTGQETERPGRPSDKFRAPFANDALARAANGGSLPPDLSVIVKARHHGENYLYSLLTGYGADAPKGVEPVPGKYYNAYFPGGWIAMADQIGLAVDAGTLSYADGTEVTKEQVAKDVVTFLAWASDPKADERKRLGMQVMAYLLALSLLLYLAYRNVWKDVKH